MQDALTGTLGQIPSAPAACCCRDVSNTWMNGEQEQAAAIGMVHRASLSFPQTLGTKVGSTGLWAVLAAVAMGREEGSGQLKILVTECT